MAKIQINTIDNMIIIGELIENKLGAEGDIIRVVLVENLPNLKGKEIEISEKETFAIFNNVTGN